MISSFRPFLLATIFLAAASFVSAQQTAGCAGTLPDGSHICRWEVGAKLIPSLQTIGISGQAIDPDLQSRYATGAALAVSYQPWRHVFLTGGLRFLDGGAIVKGDFPLHNLPGGNPDSVRFRTLEPSYLNLSLGGGLAFPAGDRITLRMEIQAQGGIKVRENSRIVWRGDRAPDYPVTGAFGRYYAGVLVSAGARVKVHPRVSLEIMPMVERQIGKSDNISGLSMHGVGLQCGAFFHF